MARLSPPSLAELSEFTGRDEAEFGDFADTALSQATLLFEMATCLDSLPDAGTFEYDMAINAILDMADSLYLSQPYKPTLASPFSSETIGSYSYSKVSQSISQGLPTGVGWFDAAVQRLGVCTNLPSVESHAITVFERENIANVNGRETFIGPADRPAGAPNSLIIPDQVF